MTNKQLVRANYKTGVYLGELLETQEENQRALVKIIAVFKHPMQGDLHQPKQTDVPLFHERKALAQFEKTWVPLSSMKAYEGEELNYLSSLEMAWRRQYEDLLQDDSDWAKQCIKNLELVRNEYDF